MISPTNSSTSVTFGSIEVIEIPSRRRRRTRPQQCHEDDCNDDENDGNDTGATTATTNVRPRYHLSMEEYESEQAMIRKQERQRRQSQRRRSTFPLRKSDQQQVPQPQNEEQQEEDDDHQDGKTLLLLNRRCPMAKFASSASTTIPGCPLRKPQRRTSQSMEDLQDAIEEVCTLLEPLSPVPACA